MLINKVQGNAEDSYSRSHYAPAEGNVHLCHEDWAKFCSMISSFIVHLIYFIFYSILNLSNVPHESLHDIAFLYLKICDVSVWLKYHPIVVFVS